jgi:GT2 family glycosyltransferase
MIAAQQPSAAVILPAWHSEATVDGSLAALACQDYPSLQVVLVESEPGGAVERMVRSKYPSVRYIPVPNRLLPHAARNLGVQYCDADLLLFSDPDIYPEPGWVSRMVAAHRQYGGVIAGPLDNATQGWLDWGVHFAKFDLFLPGGEPHRWEYCATGNMLCSRQDLERVGGFRPDHMLADLLISWSFAERGIPITFLPDAVVRHHHVVTLRGALRERYERGCDFGRLRGAHAGWSAGQTLKQTLVTLSGLRLANLVVRTGANARRARRFGWFMATLPLVTMGHAAWLAGELRGYREWSVPKPAS